MKRIFLLLLIIFGLMIVSNAARFKNGGLTPSPSPTVEALPALQSEAGRPQDETPEESPTPIPEAIVTGRYSSEFYWEQDYFDWGPADYYGQPVHVVYEATNDWVYVVENGDLWELLTQDGTAKIYDRQGKILDARPFHAFESFFDAGTDLAIRHDEGTNVWYEASHNWWSHKLEEYEYVWKISGVYEWRAWKHGGDGGYSITPVCPDGEPPKYEASVTNSLAKMSLIFGGETHMRKFPDDYMSSAPCAAPFFLSRQVLTKSFR